MSPRQLGKPPAFAAPYRTTKRRRIIGQRITREKVWWKLPRCQGRESGGFQCERVSWHWGCCRASKALRKWLETHHW